MAAVTYLPTDWLQAAFIANNLVQSQSGQARGLYREFTLGTKVNVKKIVLIYYDPHFAPDVPNASIYGHEVGLEFPMFTDAFLRVGNFLNSYVPFEQTQARGWTAGFGVLSGRSSLDYAVQHVIAPTNAFAQTVGLNLYF